MTHTYNLGWTAACLSSLAIDYAPWWASPMIALALYFGVRALAERQS